ncbi:MAG: LuxR C-terminal-related transcriptional regulator, partial [Planctomycetota bacterium]
AAVYHSSLLTHHFPVLPSVAIATDDPIFLTDDEDEQRRLLARVLKEATDTKDVRTVAAAIAAQSALREGKPAAEPEADVDMPELSPRLRETLLLLLRGEGEKQIATALGISPHTVHVHVKNLYKKFDVTTRGELLAKFVRLPAGVSDRPAGQDDA